MRLRTLRTPAASQPLNAISLTKEAVFCVLSCCTLWHRCYVSPITSPKWHHGRVKAMLKWKIHLCGLKTEVSALNSGQTIGCSPTHPGYVANIKIFRQNMEWNTDASRKKSCTKASLDGDGELCKRHVDK